MKRKTSKKKSGKRIVLSQIEREFLDALPMRRIHMREAFAITPGFAALSHHRRTRIIAKLHEAGKITCYRRMRISENEISTVVTHVKLKPEY